MWLWACFCGALLLGSVSAARADAASEPPAQAAAATDFGARLRALERVESLDASVQRPLELAKAAAARADGRRQQGDEAGARRAEQVASAALELAEARLRLSRERSLLQATAARRVAASEERSTAERALAHERARLRELEVAPIASAPQAASTPSTAGAANTRAADAPTEQKAPATNSPAADAQP